MITYNLLQSTGGRALSFVTYGGNGTRKTLAKITLPPPIFDFDFEGGNASVLPWISRMRRWDSPKWEEVSQETREQAFASLSPDNRKWFDANIAIKPKPLIDTVYYDTMETASYNSFIQDLGNLGELPHYNSIVLDSLQEFSEETKTFSKGVGRAFELMELKLWAGAQERAAIALRRLRNLRDSGVFIYLISGEQIEKDYVKDPRETSRGDVPQEPYSVKGTLNIAGKLVGTVGHLYDILMRARYLGGEPVWVTQAEPISTGGAHWEAKDRTGRIQQKFVQPNFKLLLRDIYGEEVRKAIYAAGVRASTTTQQS